MKISAILHKVPERGENDTEKVLSNVDSALKSSPAIIVGSDYSLNPMIGEITPVEFKDRIYQEFLDISRDKNVLIIPGTVLYPRNSTQVICEAPVFWDGELFGTYIKERDAGEARLAQENGFEYFRGDCSKNHFKFNGLNIALEICKDHGNQDVRRCDLEIILAFDSKAGFSPRPPCDNFARKAVVCDGYGPSVDFIDFDPTRVSGKYKLIDNIKSGSIVSAEI